MKQHKYQSKVTWTGDLGTGTSGYREYERAHSIQVNGKQEIQASSDPSFRGDPNKYNPEELFLASLSSCHMLWVLHLATVEGVVITGYEDKAEGTMEEANNGSGRFTEVTLRPHVTVKEERMLAKLDSIHQKANAMCFIANSCNFEVKHEPAVKVKRN